MFSILFKTIIFGFIIDFVDLEGILNIFLV